MHSQNTPDQNATSDAGAVLNPSAERRSNMLIIEDALIHSTLIARIADKVGFTTETAGCYEDACTLLYTRQFDCITLDLGLGQHVGREVLYHLAKIQSKAPVIIVSGSEKADCDKAVQIGRLLDLNICEPIPKPIDLKALREMLEHIRMQSGLEKFATSPI
jgi:DNA-binding NtrC family response regulator